MRGSAKEDEPSGNEADLKSLVRNPRKFDTRLEDLLQKEEIYCHVCFRMHDMKHERKSPEYDPGLRFMWCYGCLTPVHLVCHGIETPHEDVITDHGEEVTMFACDRCRHLSLYNVPICSVCKIQAGLQKRTTNNKWVHITCGLYSEEWTVHDFRTMEIGPEIEKDRPGKKARSQRKKCDNCKTSDNVLQCRSPDCSRYTHFYCALKNKIPFLAQDEETQKGWTLYFETTKVDDLWTSFDAGDEKLKYELLALYKRAEKMLSGLGESELLKLKSSRLEETKQQNNGQSGALSNKQMNKQISREVNPYEKVLKDEVRMGTIEPVNIEAANDPMFIEIYKKMQGRVFELLAKREKSSNIRGGKFYFECPAHRAVDLLCLCKKPYDSLFMIRCDYCSNWFHANCVGLRPEETEAMPEYFCQNCKDWYRYKDQQQMDIENEAFFVPKYMYRYYLCDLIEIAVILEKKVMRDAISRAGVIDIAKELPINVQGILALSFRKQILKEAADAIISFFINKTGSELPTQPVFQPILQPTIHPVIQPMTQPVTEKIKKRSNEGAVKKSIDPVEKTKGMDPVLSKSTMQGSKTQETAIEKKNEKIHWLKAYAEVTSRKTTFEEVRKLIELADRVQIKASESPERQRLEKILQSALLFIQQQKKFFADRVNQINTDSQMLQDICESATNSETFEIAEQLFSKSIAKFKELIQKRMTFSELESLITKAKSLEIDFSQLLPALENESSKVKYWRSLKPPLTFSGFVAYIKEMCSLAVFLPEMLPLLDQFEKCKRLQLRVISFLKSTECTTSRKEQSTSSVLRPTDSMISESEEKRDEVQKIHLKYAKELKQQIESQEITFEEEFQQLQEKIRFCENLQYRLQRTLETQLDPNTLILFQKEAEKAAFTFSELEELQDKIKFYQELTDIAKRPALISELQDKLNLAKSVFRSDASILNELETKINRGKFFQEKAEIFISQREFTKEDILEKSHAILNELKGAKIEIPIKESLLALEPSYRWLEKLYYFWFKKQAASPFDTMSAESSGSKGKALFNLETSWRVCLDTTLFEREYSRHSQELSQIVKYGQAIEHRDVRIREVFEKYAHLVWTRETNNLLSRPALTPKELQVVVDRARLYNINTWDPVYIQLKEIETRYLRVMESFQRFKNTEGVINLVDHRNIEERASKVLELRNHLQNLKVRNEEAIQAVNEALKVLEWMAKARNIYKLWQEGKRFNYQTLNEIASAGALMNISPENPLLQFIRERLDALSAVMEHHSRFKKTQSDFAEAVRSISQNPDENARRRLIYEVCKKKPTLVDCKNLIELIKSSGLEIEANELEKLEVNVAKTEEWCRQLDLFIANNKLENEKYNLPADRATKINAELIKFRNQVFNLPFQVESAEDKINVYDWSFTALARLSNLYKNRNTLADWIALLKRADELKPTLGIQESTFYRVLNEQIQLSTKITAQINEYRALEEKLNSVINAAKENPNAKSDSVAQIRKDVKNAMELKRLEEDLNKCKIDMSEERKYLLELYGKVKKMLDTYNQYCVESLAKGTKEPLSNFLALQENFRRLPVSLINEERNLEQLIQKARFFQKSLEDSKRQYRDSKSETKFKESAMEQYKQIPIVVKEAEDILKDRNAVRERMVSFSKRVEELRRGPKLDFSEIRQLAGQIDEINMALGQELEDLKCDVWNLQVESIRKCQENVQKGFNEEFRIRFSLLKALLADGYALLTTKTAIAKLRDNVMYIEQLLSSAEAELNEVYNIKFVELLESFHSSHQSFVDIKEEIIEYKVKLGLDPNFQPILESHVKNIFQYPDEQIISIIQQEKAAAAPQRTSPKMRGLGFNLQKSKSDKKSLERTANEKKTPSRLAKLLEKDKQRTPTTKLVQGDKTQSANKDNRMSPETSVNRDNGDWELKKKVKLTSTGESANKVIDKDKVHLKPPPEKKVKKVDETARQENRRKLGMALRQNPHFGELQEEQIKKYSKDIEVNLFSEYHEDYAKYTGKSEAIRAFLEKLKKYKFLSKMVLNKHFALDTLKSLTKVKDSELPVYEQRSETRLSKEKKNPSKKPKATATSKSSNASSSQVDDLRLLLGGPTQVQAPSRFQALVTSQKKEPVKKEPSTLANSKFEPLSPEEEEQVPHSRKKHKIADEPSYFSDEEYSSNKMISKSEISGGNQQLMDEIKPEESANSFEASNSRKEAILFDPDNDEAEFSKSITTMQKSSYDPFNVEVEMPGEEGPSSMPEIEDTDFPKGSVLKIFEGKLAKKPKGGMTVDNVLLFTTEDSSIVKLLPRFPDEIQIQGAVPNYEAQKFCEDVFMINAKPDIKL